MFYDSPVAGGRRGEKIKSTDFSTSSTDLLTDLGQTVRGSCEYKLYQGFIASGEHNTGSNDALQRLTEVVKQSICMFLKCPCCL